MWDQEMSTELFSEWAQWERPTGRTSFGVQEIVCGKYLNANMQ